MRTTSAKAPRIVRTLDGWVLESGGAFARARGRWAVALLVVGACGLPASFTTRVDEDYMAFAVLSEGGVDHGEWRSRAALDSLGLLHQGDEPVVVLGYSERSLTDLGLEEHLIPDSSTLEPAIGCATKLPDPAAFEVLFGDESSASRAISITTPWLRSSCHPATVESALAGYCGECEAQVGGVEGDACAFELRGSGCPFEAGQGHLSPRDVGCFDEPSPGCRIERARGLSRAALECTEVDGALCRVGVVESVAWVEEPLGPVIAAADTSSSAPLCPSPTSGWLLDLAPTRSGRMVLSGHARKSFSCALVCPGGVGTISVLDPAMSSITTSTMAGCAHALLPVPDRDELFVVLSKGATLSVALIDEGGRGQPELVLGTDRTMILATGYVSEADRFVVVWKVSSGVLVELFALTSDDGPPQLVASVSGPPTSASPSAAVIDRGLVVISESDGNNVWSARVLDDGLSEFERIRTFGDGTVSPRRLAFAPSGDLAAVLHANLDLLSTNVDGRNVTDAPLVDGYVTVLEPIRDGLIFFGFSSLGGSAYGGIFDASSGFIVDSSFRPIEQAAPPTAAALDPQGRLWLIASSSGEVSRIEFR
ncbi:MAG: hypothetical protein HYV07_05945 [Deltaproteobacteria bacterium]|nr:hypothetical protein [Deltaproteobacteria bacterium]